MKATVNISTENRYRIESGEANSLRENYTVHEKNGMVTLYGSFGRAVFNGKGLVETDAIGFPEEDSRSRVLNFNDSKIGVLCTPHSEQMFSYLKVGRLKSGIFIGERGNCLYFGKGYLVVSGLEKGWKITVEEGSPEIFSKGNQGFRYGLNQQGKLTIQKDSVVWQGDRPFSHWSDEDSALISDIKDKS